MTNTDAEILEKAPKMSAAFEKLEADYRAEGKEATANIVANAHDELPLESLARLYDILTAAR